MFVTFTGNANGSNLTPDGLVYTLLSTHLRSSIDAVVSGSYPSHGAKTIRLRERHINLVRFLTRRHRPHSYLEPTSATPVNSLAEGSRFRLNHSRRNLCCHRRRDSFGYRTELAGADLCFRLHGNGLGLG